MAETDIHRAISRPISAWNRSDEKKNQSATEVTMDSAVMITPRPAVSNPKRILSDRSLPSEKRSEIRSEI